MATGEIILISIYCQRSPCSALVFISHFIYWRFWAHPYLGHILPCLHHPHFGVSPIPLDSIWHSSSRKTEMTPMKSAQRLPPPQKHPYEERCMMSNPSFQSSRSTWCDKHSSLIQRQGKLPPPRNITCRSDAIHNSQAVCQEVPKEWRKSVPKFSTRNMENKKKSLTSATNKTTRKIFQLSGKNGENIL